jgi:hypothetical protein
LGKGKGHSRSSKETNDVSLPARCKIAEAQRVRWAKVGVRKKPPEVDESRSFSEQANHRRDGTRVEQLKELEH